MVKMIQGKCYIDVYLVRHGRTLWNQQKRYLGHTDVPLLEAARKELTGLRELLSHVSFDQIYVSDLVRCTETLRIIAPDLVSMATTDTRLREYHFGEFEGQTYEMLKHRILYRQWIDDPVHVTPPGAETFAHFAERIQQFAEERIKPSLLGEGLIKDKDKNMEEAMQNILVVTHGGVIRQWAAAWLKEAEFATFMPKPGECLVLRFALQDGELFAQKMKFHT
ncbi:histidine phosphatase family protein [Paenibacillus sp. Marseille-Q4541]|uniref:histidine phosphatase family protein n=1 Tax=Paenibacillus sp. Marseille-Q4541 TaxID=2831522 RepID=UPI001BAC0A99|nr:histidine phosphatase family protein [Paenibacillus sp. Marseille-Q4541]